jgi:soluble P-type ATPase
VEESIPAMDLVVITVGDSEQQYPNARLGVRKLQVNANECLRKLVDLVIRAIREGLDLLRQSSEELP